MPPPPPRFQYPSKILITFLGDKIGLVNFIAFMHCNNKCQFPPNPKSGPFCPCGKKATIISYTLHIIKITYESILK